MPLVIAFHPYFAIDNPEDVKLTTNATRYYDNKLPENKASMTKETKLTDATELKKASPKDPALYKIEGNPDIHLIDNQYQRSGNRIITGPRSSVKIQSKNLPNLTVWRAGPKSKAICVEPSSGFKNALVQSINQKVHKKATKLSPGQSKTFEVSIKATVIATKQKPTQKNTPKS